MRNPFSPFEFFRIGMTLGTIAVEAQMVIAMRLMGLAGFWTLGRGETRRMVAEKTAAFREGLVASGRAGMAGRGPLAQTRAALAPVRRRTKSNSRRLGRKGPRLPR